MDKNTPSEARRDTVTYVNAVLDYKVKRLTLQYHKNTFLGVVITVLGCFFCQTGVHHPLFYVYLQGRIFSFTNNLKAGGVVKFHGFFAIFASKDFFMVLKY